MEKGSRISIGIASSEISKDVRPGHWNNTVGYHSETGRCFSSHTDLANTNGNTYGIGDVVGVLVTYFGEDKSTVTFLKNDQPIATRFLFESDHQKFLPTLSLEKGNIELDVTWPEAAMGEPQYSEKNLLHWIMPAGVMRDTVNTAVSLESGGENIFIQSPQPLTSDFHHFEVIVQKVSLDGRGPVIGLANCSSLKHRPTSSVMQEAISWHAPGKTLKAKEGMRIGWGIMYNPDNSHSVNFDPKEQQLVMCYVTIDGKIANMKMMLQPTGGFYPYIVLDDVVCRVIIDVETNRNLNVEVLSSKFREDVTEISKQLQSDILSKEITHSMFRQSESLKVVIEKDTTCVHLPNLAGIHLLQFHEPLTKDQCCFTVEIKKLGENSVIVAGIAGEDIADKYPGQCDKSVGWMSLDGMLYSNNKCAEHFISATTFGAGDTIRVEVVDFGSALSVVLFSKNLLPVGTRFLTQKDRSQFLPTIVLCGNGHEVEIDVCWQTNILKSRKYNVELDAEHWCLPAGSIVEMSNNMIHVKPHDDVPVVLQSPYSLHPGFDHFEVKVTDNNIPLPIVAVCTASPLIPKPKSQFRPDFLSFRMTDGIIKTGDKVGWGLFCPHQDKMSSEQTDRFIYYLTINRKIHLTRVVFQPPGGFYPLIILPPGLNDVQLDLTATDISSHTDHPLKVAGSKLIDKANKMIDKEEQRITDGDNQTFDNSELFVPVFQKVVTRPKQQKSKICVIQ